MMPTFAAQANHLVQDNLSGQAEQHEKHPDGTHHNLIQGHYFRMDILLPIREVGRGPKDESEQDICCPAGNKHDQGDLHSCKTDRLHGYLFMQMYAVDVLFLQLIR